MFDLVLKNGRIIDAENCVLTPPADVGVSGGIISGIGRPGQLNAKEIIDCTDKFIAPGFIDAHVHIESAMVTPKEFASAVLPHGTTTCIADPHEIVNVGGADALDAFLEMCDGAAIDIFAVVPSSVPATPFDTNGAGTFKAEDMKRFADDNRIVGLGEVMCFPEVLRKDKSVTDKIRLFKSKGKTIDGHTAGLDGDCVAAYAAAGIENDHECTTFEEAKIRMKNGMNVYLREGSAAHNLKDIASGFARFNKETEKSGALPISKLAFCTDDKHLSSIAREGHIDYNVRLAVKSGFTLAEAIRAASYNPARFYALNDRGSVETGKKADLVVLENESAPKVTAVIKNGTVITPVDVSGRKFRARDSFENKKYLQNSVKYKNFTAADFVLPETENYVGLGLVDGQLLTDKLEFKRDEIKNILATIERYGKNGNYALCPVSGYGIKNGAVATSVSHDSHNVVVAGDNPADMASAVNRLREIGGGYVIAREGKIAGELRLDVAGLMSSEPAEVVSAKIDELDETAKKMGVNPKIDPFTTLSFTALPVIPFVRLLDTGLFDVLNQKFIR